MHWQRVYIQRKILWQLINSNIYIFITFVLYLGKHYFPFLLPRNIQISQFSLSTDFISLLIKITDWFISNNFMTCYTPSCIFIIYVSTSAKIHIVYRHTYLTNDMYNKRRRKNSSRNLSLKALDVQHGHVHIANVSSIKTKRENKPGERGRNFSRLSSIPQSKKVVEIIPRG